MAQPVLQSRTTTTCLSLTSKTSLRLHLQTDTAQRLSRPLQAQSMRDLFEFLCGQFPHHASSVVRNGNALPCALNSENLS
jgi:hypothetical protein